MSNQRIRRKVPTKIETCLGTIPIKYQSFNDRDGDYCENKQEIRINTAMDPDRVMSVIAHELLHYILDVTGYGRQMYELGRSDVSFEEGLVTMFQKLIFCGNILKINQDLFTAWKTVTFTGDDDEDTRTTSIRRPRQTSRRSNFKRVQTRSRTRTVKGRK